MNVETFGLLILFVAFFNSLMSFNKKKSNLLYCGLVGFSGTKGYNVLKLKFLLYWNSVERGLDATGIFTPLTGVLKDNIKAELFINNPNKLGKVKLDKTLIGHVRAKTVGTNVAANAHPFEYGRIVGAHNGTLKNHLAVAYNYGFDVNKFDVDSQVLFAALSRDFEAPIENKFSVLGKYEGAAALLFYDKKEKALYACHDKERPLYYGYFRDTEMYISSIKECLEAIGCSKITSFPVNVVHKIVDGKIVETSAYTVKVPTVTKTIPQIVGPSEIKTIYLQDGGAKLVLPDYAKGIMQSAVESYMLKGFLLRICVYNTDTPTLKYDHYYYCKDAAPDKNGNKYVILIDSEGKEVECSLVKIDFYNFIPVKGGYVMTSCDIVKTKEPNNVIIPYKSVCQVLTYAYGDPYIQIMDIITKRKVNVEIDGVRTLIYSEQRDLDAFLEDREKKRLALLQEASKNVQQEEGKQLSLIVPPTCEINVPEQSIDDEIKKLNDELDNLAEIHPEYTHTNEDDDDSPFDLSGPDGTTEDSEQFYSESEVASLFFDLKAKIVELTHCFASGDVNGTELAIAKLEDVVEDVISGAQIN